MKNITVEDILNICSGKLICGNKKDICENFCKDTRILQNGDVYVGIKGENFDGNTLYKKAIKNGAKVCILQGIEVDEEYIKNKEVSIILVDDTIKAIGKIANFKRNLYGKDFPVIAVTGSVGKTSTKDIIASVVSEKYKVLKTEGNMNNHIGLPFTILKLKDEEALVVEMGMNHFGEIDYLTNIAEPNIAVITNIGTSHIGNLGSRENILKAKLEILNSKNIKNVVINNDNDLLHKWYEENKNKYEIHTYGIENSSESIAKEISLMEQSSKFTAITDDEKYEITVPVGGEHFVYNALCALTVGRVLGLSKKEIENGIKKFELTKKRMEISKIKDNVTIINDSYNASFDSMKAALKYLKDIEGERKIAVLGDMLELGSYAEDLHRKVGKEFNKNNIDVLVTVGELSKNINNVVNTKENYHFENNKEAEVFLNKELKQGDVALFKASNGMKFFEIIEKLK